MTIAHAADEQVKNLPQNATILDVMNVYEEAINVLHVRIMSLLSQRNEVKKEITTSIEILGLSARPENCLLDNGVRTIEELTTYSKRELERFRNMGYKSILEIETKLNQRNLKLK